VGVAATLPADAQQRCEGGQKAYEMLQNEVEQPWLASCLESAALSETLRTIATLAPSIW